MTFLTEAGEQELDRAIEAIEAVSSVEIVIAVRSRARNSLIQHGVVGLILATGTLAFTLYSPIVFAVWQIMTLPICAGLFGAFLVEAIPPLYRFVEPPWLRYEHVREAAYATFIERGVHGTRDRTGLLVYVAVREHMVELVGDLTVVEKLGIEGLAAMAGTLEAALPHGAEALGKQLAGLATQLGEKLPRKQDDTNEIGNRVANLGAPPRQPSDDVSTG